MALVLSLRLNESLYIGDIQVKLARIRDGDAKLAITAPLEVKILREKFYKKPEPAKEEPK